MKSKEKKKKVLLGTAVFMVVVFIVLWIIKLLKFRILGSVYSPTVWPELVLTSIFSAIIFYFWTLFYLRRKEKRKDLNQPG